MLAVMRTAGSQARDELKDRLQNVRPAAYDVGDHIADGVANVLASTVTPEDSAKEIADSAYNAADRTAHRVDYIVADVFKNLGDDVDEFLDESADLNEDKFDHGYDDLDQPDDGLKYQLANEAHWWLPPASSSPNGAKDQEPQDDFSLDRHTLFLMTQHQTRRHLSIVKAATLPVCGIRTLRPFRARACARSCLTRRTDERA